MKVKISDFIADHLVECGITHNFTVPGGGAMHMNVSFGHKEGLKNVFVQHEQAASMAAEAYYRMSNKLPLVCCTTGPGGTNTLTGVLDAYVDSIPMLVISGQVKYSMTVRSLGVDMRTYGDQEFDITKVVKNMTKYAVMVTKPELIKYHLDKAMWIAMHGRPGPVWIDVPLNIQWDMIDTDDLVEFDPSEMENTLPRPTSDKVCADIIDKIKQAKRPVVFSGVELRTNGAYGTFIELINKLNVPVVTSYDGIDIIEEDHRLYAGRAGDMANRPGNWAVQNSDLLLVIGSRLGIRQVSYATDKWARESYVIMVHPDPLELAKPNIHIEMPVRADFKEFCEKLSEHVQEPLPIRKEWLDICKKWLKEYPVADVKRHYKQAERANVICMMNELSKVVPENTPVVSGNGSACVVGGSAFLIRKGQRYILNSASASMGFDLPATIGVAFANDLKDMVCITGDGSIQMNLQELQTIVFHKIPVKIVLINNNGYHSMRQTQNNLFAGMSKVGVGPETGDLSFPDMHKIADAYGIPYMCIRNNQEMEKGLKQLFSMKGYALCEVFVDSEQVFEPKPSAMKLPDGSLISPPLEDLAPFLPREELEKIMIIPMVDDSKK